MSLRSCFLELLATAPHFEPTDESHCGCILDAGSWGSGGWHLKRYDPAALYARARALFARERPDWTREALARGWAAWLAEQEDAGRFDGNNVHIFWRPYLGLPYAFEPCGPYRAKVKQALDAQQAEKISDNRRHYEMPPNATISRRSR